MYEGERAIRLTHLIKLTFAFLYHLARSLSASLPPLSPCLSFSQAELGSALGWLVRISGKRLNKLLQNPEALAAQPGASRADAEMAGGAPRRPESWPPQSFHFYMLFSIVWNKYFQLQGHTKNLITLVCGSRTDTVPIGHEMHGSLHFWLTECVLPIKLFQKSNS